MTAICLVAISLSSILSFLYYFNRLYLKSVPFKSDPIYKPDLEILMGS